MAFLYTHSKVINLLICLFFCLSGYSPSCFLFFKWNGCHCNCRYHSVINISKYRGFGRDTCKVKMRAFISPFISISFFCTANFNYIFFNWIILKISVKNYSSFLIHMHLITSGLGEWNQYQNRFIKYNMVRSILKITFNQWKRIFLLHSAKKFEGNHYTPDASNILTYCNSTDRTNK